MDKHILNSYIKNTEQMILPEKVSAVTQFSGLMEKLPMSFQKRIVKSSSKKSSHMGFVVEPYSFFLSHEITDTEAAEKLLPPGYRLIPSAMFTDTAPRPSLIIGAFNVHTSMFWGSRVEVYLIAENIKTGLLSWIIVDYETNTNSYDPGQGFAGATTARSVVTTSYRGDVIIDIEGKDSGNRLALTAPVIGAPSAPLDQRLWVEGNLSVDYGGKLSDGNSAPFSLIFDAGEMETAMKIDLNNMDFQINTLCGNIADSNPYEAGCFPFAQHFVTTSLPVQTGMRNAEDLDKAVTELGSDKTVRTKKLKEAS